MKGSNINVQSKKLGRPLQTQFSLSLLVISTKFLCTLESWGQDNSKTPPAVKDYLKNKGATTLAKKLISVLKFSWKSAFLSEKLKSLNVNCSVFHGTKWKFSVPIE